MTAKGSCGWSVLWFCVTDQRGHEWRVYLARPDGVRDFRHKSREHRLAGLTYPDTRDIFIDVTLSEAEQDEVAMHELLHAAFAAGSENRKRDELVHARTEEKAVILVTEPILTMATQLGMKIPRRPRGYAALRRGAMHLEGD